MSESRLNVGDGIDQRWRVTHVGRVNTHDGERWTLLDTTTGEQDTYNGRRLRALFIGTEEAK